MQLSAKHAGPTPGRQVSPPPTHLHTFQPTRNHEQSRLGSGALKSCPGSVATQANPATSTALQLSIYPATFSSQVASSAASSWLGSVIPHIVNQACGRPFLQLVFTHPRLSLRSVPLSHDTADNSKAWQLLAEHATAAGADGLVLVRPLPPQTVNYPCAGSCQPVNSRGVDGKVGHECCGSSSDSSPIAGEDGHAPSPLQERVCYFGLVVQSRSPNEADGCYLLKTARNSEPTGCSCTHYTLTQLCQGQPLHDQVKSIWLI